MTGEVRDRMYTIPLEEIKDFKASNFALNRYITGNGEKIHLSAFANNIGLIEAVGSVAGK